MTRCVKVLGHSAVRIYKVVTGSTAIEVKVYRTSVSGSSLINTVTLSVNQVAAWEDDGYLDIAMTELIPDTLSDSWYDLTITVGDGPNAGVDADAGFGYTADATNKLYSRIMAINPVSPTFSVSQAYHTAKMLLDEMNWLENYEVPRRVYQFDKRLILLKEILGYA